MPRGVNGHRAGQGGQSIAVPATCMDPQVLALLNPTGAYIGSSMPDDD